MRTTTGLRRLQKLGWRFVSLHAVTKGKITTYTAKVERPFISTAYAKVTQWCEGVSHRSADDAIFKAYCLAEKETPRGDL